jgi:retron-type reverse transcriptase
LKRHKNLYQQICDFENLYLAYLNARRGKRYRDEVLRFTERLEENLIEIQNELIWKTYRVGRYREFYVYESKKRLIMALPFKDRVVQWAIYRVLNPLLERRYILDSYACRVGFGAHRSVDRLQYWLRQLDRQHSKVYALKLDISKYFYRVDHAVLMSILRHMIADRDFLWLLETIIRCDHTKFGLLLDDYDFHGDRIGEVGMPIGNLTSQMFANLYLHELDQFVKHTLRVHHYLRYMDDTAILHWDKSYLWQVKQEIEAFLSQRLHLALNNKTAIRTIDQGIEWVGYRVWPTHRKLRKSTAKKMKSRLKYLQQLYAMGEIGFHEVNASVQSYLGLLKHCNSYKLRQKLFEALAFVRESGAFV